MEELSNIIKKYREKKGISLQELSERTKIRKNIISAIEQGDFSLLPPVYGTSFLKTIVQYLEIPEEEYSSLLSPIKKKEKDIVKTTQKANFRDYGSIKGAIKIFGIEINPNFINYALYFAFGLIVLILLYISLFYEKETPKQPDLPIIEGTPSDDAQIIISEEGEEDSEAFAADSINLSAYAIDTAWVRIDIDGKRLDEVLFVPKQGKSWNAKEYFIIQQGNYGAIEYKRNGKVLEPFGSPGNTVRNVRITRDKVITPTPW